MNHLKTIKCIGRPIKAIDFQKMHGENVKLFFSYVLNRLN